MYQLSFTPLSFISKKPFFDSVFMFSGHHRARRLMPRHLREPRREEQQEEVEEEEEVVEEEVVVEEVEVEEEVAHVGLGD